MERLDFHDPVASATHLLMAGWMLFASAFVLRLAAGHSPPKRISVGVYGVSVVSLYLFSGLFHGVRHDPATDSRRVWQLLDQTAIFWLIYGSNAPMFVYALPKRVRNQMVFAQGGFALLGTLALWLLPKPPHALLVGVFLGMGLMSLIPLRSYFRKLGWPGMGRIALLCGLYVAGGVCEIVRWPNPVPGMVTYHEMFHLFDVAGTLAHYGLLVRVVSGDATRAKIPG